MEKEIDTRALFSIWQHYLKIRPASIIKGLPYERCAELPYIINQLKPKFVDNLKLLDIGSGESPLPSWFLVNTSWDITCLDKFSWVRNQQRFAERVAKNFDDLERFHVTEKDFIDSNFPEASFDIITSISVIEHMEGEKDALIMEESAKLLKPGGIYILTTLINEGFYKEYYENKPVYGELYKDAPVFYQRHYDIQGINQRLIKPSGLQEHNMVYFGEYNFQAFDNLFQRIPKLIRVFYQWATPLLAKRFLSYNSIPVSRKDMLVNTSSGVILVLQKMER